MGIMTRIFIAGIVLGDALDKFFDYKKEIEIVNWKGHTFSVDLNSGTTGGRLVPGDEKTLSFAIRKASTTDNAYMFMTFDCSTDEAAWVDHNSEGNPEMIKELEQNS